ncbi:MAG: thermonuclease family protein [Acidimicrobiales bacterium]|nr:thermonuclease family protein [Acidimicrobiales bacterium]
MPRAVLRLLTSLLVLSAACSGSADTATDANSTDDTSATLSLAPTSTGDDGNDGAPTPPATLPDQADLEPNAIVERVVDGDTIIVEIHNTRGRVRLLGIDTPESVAENRPDQCCGAESSEYLRGLLPEGTEVTLIRDVQARDRYDRLLAYVVRTQDQLFVNLDLLERGFAGVLIYEPNSYYRNLFEDAEDAAVDGGIRLWSACGGPDVPLD